MKSERRAGTGLSRCGPRERRSARPVPALRGPLHERPVLDRGLAGRAVSVRSLRRQRTGRLRGGRAPPPPSRTRQAGRCRRAARRHGGGLRRLRCLGRMGLENGLRRLRGGDRAVPAQIRKSAFPQSRISGRRAAAAGQGRRPSPHPYAPFCRERDLSAVLDADPARPCRIGRRRHHAGRPRAGAIGRHRPARHFCRGRRRHARPERAGRDARKTARRPLSGRHRHAVRRRADRRSPRRRHRAERGADEPAILGHGERLGPHGRRRLSPCRFRAGASRRWRAAGCDHRRELRARCARLAGRLHPLAGARPRGVHRRDRRRGLCEARHDDRHAPDRHRQGAGGRPDGFPHFSWRRAGCRHAARLDRRACAGSLADRVFRRCAAGACRRAAHGSRLSRPGGGIASQAVDRRTRRRRARL